MLQGVYLHGPVGRGKSPLVDVLRAAPRSGLAGCCGCTLPTRPRQLHAHLFRHAKASGATDRAVSAMLSGVRLLIPDELHAHDPNRAMLLSRLVRAATQHRPVLVATSNCPPRGCCPTRVHR